MRRREFVAGLASVSTVLVGWPAWASHLFDGWAASPAESLLAAFEHPHSAAAVGRAYLASHPDDADAGRLVEAVTTRLHCQGCDPARAGKGTLRAAISRQVRDDFANSRVVRVDGWVLSATEAQLCGLAALSRV